MVIAAMKLKDTYSLEGKQWKNLDCVLKGRDITLLTKVPYSQSYGFSSSHVQIWELDCKEGWAPENWCFWIVVLKKTFESPLNCKEIQPISPKEISPEYSSEGLMMKLQYFGHLMQRTDSLEKTLMLGKIEGKRRRGQQRTNWLGGIINSMNINLSKLWRIVEERGTWSAAVHGIAKSWTQLRDWTTTAALYSWCFRC